MPEPTTSEYIQVRKSTIHNNGVFASKDIPKGTRIIEYVGEKITKKESEKRADVILAKSKEDVTRGAVYIFELNDKYDIDGSVDWNTARYINHSCNPNCEAVHDEGKIFIEAVKKIKQGEELSYNYGYDIDNYEEHPCRCGAPNCIGYIVKKEDWSKLKRKLAKKSRKEKRQEKERGFLEYNNI